MLLCCFFANVVQGSITSSEVWVFVVFGTQMRDENYGWLDPFVWEDVCTCCLATGFERRSRCRALGTIIRLQLGFLLTKGPGLSLSHTFLIIRVTGKFIRQIFVYNIPASVCFFCSNRQPSNVLKPLSSSFLSKHLVATFTLLITSRLNIYCFLLPLYLNSILLSFLKRFI